MYNVHFYTFIISNGVCGSHIYLPFLKKGIIFSVCTFMCNCANITFTFLERYSLFSWNVRHKKNGIPLWLKISTLFAFIQHQHVSQSDDGKVTFLTLAFRHYIRRPIDIMLYYSKYLELCYMDDTNLLEVCRTNIMEVYRNDSEKIFWSWHIWNVSFFYYWLKVRVLPYLEKNIEKQWTSREM